MARIHMTPMVRYALYFLRVYLLVLLVLILLKFIMLFTGRSTISPSQAPATTPAKVGSP